MIKTRRSFLIGLASAFFMRLFATQIIAKQNIASDKTAAKPSEILLTQVYKSGINVRHYLVSEKYDGVRALWDGKALYTRAGRLIAAPAWFTKGFPNTPLDGELWLARGQFDAVSGAVRKDKPIDAEWRGISYLVFELPNATGTFKARSKHIKQIIDLANVSHLKAVTQFEIKDEAALKFKLKQMVADGAEGLMLHKADALYLTGRSDALLKLKPYYDAEATVIGHTPGRGKYKGKLGALLVETPKGIRFKLGTGFSDAQRENPPKVGSLVTYSYHDKTKNGRPKFASFLRVRVN